MKPKILSYWGMEGGMPFAQTDIPLGYKNEAKLKIVLFSLCIECQLTFLHFLPHF